MNNHGLGIPPARFSHSAPRPSPVELALGAMRTRAPERLCIWNGYQQYVVNYPINRTDDWRDRFASDNTPAVGAKSGWWRQPSRRRLLKTFPCRGGRRLSAVQCLPRKGGILSRALLLLLGSAASRPGQARQARGRYLTVIQVLKAPYA